MMEENNVGAAMQFLQSKALCIMPISLATAIYHTQPPDNTTLVKPEINPPSWKGHQSLESVSNNNTILTFNFYLKRLPNAFLNTWLTTQHVNTCGKKWE